MVAPVPTAGVVFLITRKHLDLSAFLVVAWCTYRNVNTLKLSVVIRTIVAEATIYFLAMVALQISVQLSLILAVQSLSPRPHSISWSLIRIPQESIHSISIV